MNDVWGDSSMKSARMDPMDSVSEGAGAETDRWRQLTCPVHALWNARYGPPVAIWL